jgi:hypothetical protein
MYFKLNRSSNFFKHMSLILFSQIHIVINVKIFHHEGVQKNQTSLIMFYECKNILNIYVKYIMISYFLCKNFTFSQHEYYIL